MAPIERSSHWRSARGSAAPPQSTYLSLDDLAQAEREYRAALRIAPGARCGMSRVMFAEP